MSYWWLLFPLIGFVLINVVAMGIAYHALTKEPKTAAPPPRGGRPSSIDVDLVKAERKRWP